MGRGPGNLVPIERGIGCWEEEMVGRWTGNPVGVDGSRGCCEQVVVEGSGKRNWHLAPVVTACNSMYFVRDAVFTKVKRKMFRFGMHP